MPSALNSFERETQHPSLLERTATGRPTRRRLNTCSQDTKKLFQSTSPIIRVKSEEGRGKSEEGRVKREEGTEGGLRGAEFPNRRKEHFAYVSK